MEFKFRLKAIGLMNTRPNSLAKGAVEGCVEVAEHTAASWGAELVLTF